MQAFETETLIAEQAAGGKRYLEFLRVPDLSMGLYALKAGEPDPQNPHSEDEVYVIMEGRGRIRVGDEDRVVRPGSIVYVAKTVPHKFHDIVEDLKVLVFFAPAET
jgi:mannose-6-phosphate isomerase-like protein (cupin superfamily)